MKRIIIIVLILLMSILVGCMEQEKVYTDVTCEREIELTTDWENNGVDEEKYYNCYIKIQKNIDGWYLNRRIGAYRCNTTEYTDNCCILTIKHIIENKNFNNSNSDVYNYYRYIDFDNFKCGGEWDFYLKKYTLEDVK